MAAIREKSKEINAADVEHLGALLVGGVLLAKGLHRKGPIGALLGLAGMGMLYRGQQGYRRLYDLIGVALPRCPTGVGRNNVRVEARIVINRPRSEVYRIWRHLSNLPVFMDHLLSVHEIDDVHSLWAARAPAGMVIKWEAEIINDIEDELIAWQSLEGSGVDSVGSIHFSDVNHRATLLHLVFRYDPPADMLGVIVAKLFRNDPQRQIESDLRRFKRILELGNRPARPRHDGCAKTRA
jgi:uncharacterized membrane protein